MLAAISLALLTSSLPETIHVTVNGQDRTALVYPPADASRQAPLVFAFHGHGGGMIYAARRYQISGAWPEAIVVYAQGLPTAGFYDPQGKQNGWDVKATSDNKDLLYFDALLKKVEAQHKVDDKRIFAMGHSNGAGFVYTLWGTRANILAGVGVFEGRKNHDVTLKAAKPFFLTIGDQDPLVRPALQHDSMQAGLDANAANGPGRADGPNETLYLGKRPVELWAYHGGHDFQATAIKPMVDFWKRAAG